MQASRGVLRGSSKRGAGEPAARELRWGPACAASSKDSSGPAATPQHRVAVSARAAAAAEHLRAPVRRVDAIAISASAARETILWQWQEEPRGCTGCQLHTVSLEVPW